MELVPLDVAGAWHVRAPVHGDTRGALWKPFEASRFAALGLQPEWREHYLSRSRAGVVRGMHCQLPPHDHAKLVSVVAGHVTDVVLDVRAGAAYGRHATVELEVGDAVYVPRGCAHGFVARSGEAILSYLVTSVHAPDHDGGVRWDSCGINWAVDEPVVSARDAALPPLAEFASPFCGES